MNVKNKKVAFYTLGCKLNSVETATIAEKFEERGYCVSAFGEEVDVTVINTCTVTDSADSSCRNIIRKANKNSPEGSTIVIGCYSQMDPDAISKIDGVDLIIGTSDKYKLFNYLDNLNNKDKQIVNIEKSDSFFSAVTTPVDGHTRAFLKIQDGCNYVCSYCIIPFARGKSRACSIDDAISDAKKILSKEFKEIVLTGVNVGEYESSSGEKLSDCVLKLLELDGLKRLRLSSVEPNTITDELLEAFKSSSKFMDNFHIPMQSGDDRVLSDMRRKYTAKEYKSIVKKAHSYFPTASFGADIIVGFPGETEEEFENTKKLIEELPITHLHVFPFSSRKGTTAAGRNDHISSEIKKKRVKILMSLGELKLADFSRKLINTTNSVLFEKRDKNGFFEGYTTNYIRVKVDTIENLENEIRDVRLTKFENGELIGELV